MKRKLQKAYAIPPVFRQVRMSGIPPTAEQKEAMKLMSAKPRQFKAEMLLDHTEPVLRPEKIVLGLGLDAGQESEWIKFLESVMTGSTNEVVVRQELHSRMQAERMDPEMRRVVMQRSMQYYKGTLKKARVQVVTPDDLLKAEARGGNYHRRVTTEKGKTRYYYDEEKYNKSKHAQLSGKETRQKAMEGKVRSAIEKAEDGCDAHALKALAKRYGAKDVGDYLKRGCGDGSFEYKKGRFYSKAVKKSMRPVFTLRKG